MKVVCLRLFVLHSKLPYTPKEAWELFGHLSGNSQLHAASSHSDVPRQFESKGKIYEVSHSIELSSKVDALIKKF